MSVKSITLNFQPEKLTIIFGKINVSKNFIENGFIELRVANQTCKVKVSEEIERYIQSNKGKNLLLNIQIKGNKIEELVQTNLNAWIKQSYYIAQECTVF